VEVFEPCRAADVGRLEVRPVGLDRLIELQRGQLRTAIGIGEFHWPLGCANLVVHI